MRKPEAPAQHCLLGRISFGIESDPQGQFFLSGFFLASQRPCRNARSRQAECRLKRFLRSRCLQELGQFLNQEKIQAPLPAMFGLPKLQNYIPGINAAARRFLRPGSWQRLCNAKQRIVTVDDRQKILNSQTGRRVSGTFAGSCSPPRYLFDHLYAHACEATRSESAPQAQNLASTRPVFLYTNSRDLLILLESLGQQ